MIRQNSMRSNSSSCRLDRQASINSLKGGFKRRKSNVRMSQNVLLIWLDSDINNDNVDYLNTITQLRSIVHTIDTFTESDLCIEFLMNMEDEKACLIVSGSLGQEVVPQIHNMCQVDSIFILTDDKEYDQEWINEWPKIKGVFTEIPSTCEALKKAIEQCEENIIPITFMDTNDDISKKNLDELDVSFTCTHLLKEILSEVEFNQEDIIQFIRYCRTVLVGNEVELKNIQKFEQDYRTETPIWWYTYKCFLCSMVKRALRSMDTFLLMKLSSFIGDLHRHIEQLHQQQFSNNNFDQNFKVYRGQGMTEENFDKMSEAEGGLLSFNGFLSASKNRTVSLLSAEKNQTNPDLIGILFVMTIDLSKAPTSFASINHVSHLQIEDEVLFSIHTVFRIGNIKPLDENHRLFEVELTLTCDDDKDLQVLSNRIRKETEGSNGCDRLGELLLKMGQAEKAYEVYEILLEHTTKECEKPRIYQQLGNIKYFQDEYKVALTFYEKELEIQQQFLPPNHPDLASTYNIIGLVYYNLCEDSKALVSLEKVLEIRQKSLPSNHIDLAKIYNNIGTIYYNMDEYAKSLSSYEKALEIKQQSLLPTDPSLASTYDNIGIVQYNMGEHSKALSAHEKALAIRENSLPSMHPDLAKSYNNLSSIYHNTGEYSKSLFYYEKAQEIEQESFPSNHPELPTLYNNTGEIHL